MSEILNQSEVDALLSAVAKGEMKPGAPATGDASAQGYDFSRPERIGRDRLRVLTALYETFARNVGAQLSGAIRRTVEARLASVEQSTFGDFAETPGPRCLMVLTAKPLPGTPILEIDPAFVFPVIDRLLGGTGDANPLPDRPITDIEGRLLVKLVTPLLGLLKEACGPGEPIDFAVSEVRTSAQLFQSAAPHDPLVLATFDVRMGETSGHMRLATPCATIEPLLERFGVPAHPAVQTPESNPGQISRSLSEAQLDVVADLAVTQITVRELMDLEPGDLLKTGAEMDSEATVYVEGIPKFKGKPGRNRRNKAILISRPIEPGRTR